MTAVELNLGELIGLILSFLLTLFVLSYVFSDNFLFRFAVYLFIGVSAGLVIAAAFYGVIWPDLIRPLIFGELEERLLALVPLVMGILLFSKTTSRFSFLGSPVMAYMVGVGAATIIGGAVLGTLIPQVGSSISLFDQRSMLVTNGNGGSNWINQVLILVGLVAALASFQFRIPPIHRPAVRKIWSAVYTAGRLFIAVAFGVIFVGVLTASLTALVERVGFLKEFFLFFLIPGL